MKILELTLHSTDLDAQRIVYSEKLGMEVVEISNEEIMIKSGMTKLRFRRAEQQFYYHYCF